MIEAAVDVLVIGAGPAGCRAAITARAAGLRVALVDEFPAAGGQVYRAPPPGFARVSAKAEPEARAGDALREQLAASEVETHFGHRVWSVAPGFEVAAVGAGEPRRWRSRVLIVATGTTERVVPFAGWTLPGVVGLGAATVLLKSQGMLPGRRTVVAGCGPLVPAVAAGILHGGGEIAAVVDLGSATDWLSELPALASRLDLFRRGTGWLAAIRRAGVPVFSRHAVVAVEGGDRVTSVVIRPVDRTWRPKQDVPSRTIAADSVVVGHGLVPSTEITRLLHAEHDFRDEAGGWIAVTDNHGRTSVDGLLVAGDCAGIAGAEPAALRGTLAGLAAARDLGRLTGEKFALRAAPVAAALRKASRFGAASARLMRVRAGLWSGIAPDTVVCRCEEVTRGEIDAIRLAGATLVNGLKVGTRCGMGPCQGRYCGEAAAAILSGDAPRSNAGQWTPRLPLRPVPLGALVAGTEDGAA